jgi:hypothetical protein
MSRRLPGRSARRAAAAALSLAAAVAPGATGQERETALGAASLAADLRSVPVGGTLRLRGVARQGTPLQPARLERFEVLAPGARIVERFGPAPGETRSLPAPDNRYFRGRLDDGTRLYLSQRANGELRGILAGAGRYWILSNRSGGRALAAPRTEPVAERAFAERDFACEADRLVSPRQQLEQLGLLSAPAPAPAAAGVYSAQVGIESDFEYYQLFGNATDAADYALDLIAYASSTYAHEISTELTVSHLSIHSTSADPWQEFSTTCGMLEFGRFWNDNRSGVSRSFAHFLSGKGNGGGVAWLGTLCGGPFNVNVSGAGCSLAPAVDNYGGDYGYSGTLDGNFDLENPSVVWDVVVTQHEIGHNFDSPHTHCYAGIGGASPVDACYGAEEGCYAGAGSLPSGCPGPGQGCGTLMSYCHLLPGGMANVGPSFGTGHPYGTDPDRVASRMSSFVAARNLASPGCLPEAGLFDDGFETGDTSAWSASLP